MENEIVAHILSDISRWNKINETPATSITYNISHLSLALNRSKEELSLSFDLLNKEFLKHGYHCSYDSRFIHVALLGYALGKSYGWQ